MTESTSTHRTLEVLIDHPEGALWANVYAQVAGRWDGDWERESYSQDHTGVIRGTRLNGFVTQYTKPREGDLKIAVSDEIDIYKVNDYLAQFKRLMRGFQRIMNDEGEATSFGVQCVRFARITGCKSIAIWRPGEKTVETEDFSEAALVIDSVILTLKEMVTQ